jgi:tRNA 2-thiouridine synthesizing protein A
MSIVLSDEKLVDVTAENVVDTRGSRCPLPLLDARREIVHVEVGSVLELWSSDSQCRKDVRSWADKVGHEFLGYVADAGYDRIFVRRTK